MRFKKKESTAVVPIADKPEPAKGKSPKPLPDGSFYCVEWSFGSGFKNIFRIEIMSINNIFRSLEENKRHYLKNKFPNKFDGNLIKYYDKDFMKIILSLIDGMSGYEWEILDTFEEFSTLVEKKYKIDTAKFDGMIGEKNESNN